RPIRGDTSSRAVITTTALAHLRRLTALPLGRALRSSGHVIRILVAGLVGIVLAVTVGLLLPVHRLPQYTRDGAPAVPPSAAPRADGMVGATGARVTRRLPNGLPLIIGHRGGTERGCQNSMAAF